jgi:protein-disulfide isomerase
MPKSQDTSGNPTRRGLLRAFGLGVVTAGLTRTPTLAETSDEVLTEAQVLRDQEIPAAGNVHGDITIVEYFDYNCSYCRKLAPELAQVVHDDGKVRLILKDWPILGPGSVYASRLALASKYQDKFVVAHEALISTSSRLTEPHVRELLADAKIDSILKRNSDQAVAFGFNGTPAFIIGKFRVPGVLTTTQFGQAIADARKAAATKTK